MFSGHRNVELVCVAPWELAAPEAHGPPMYYCQAEKIGQLFSDGTRTPHRDYLVEARWIFHLLQGQKMTCAAARKAVVATCQNVGKGLAELVILEQEATRERVEAQAAAAEASLRASRRSWRMLPQVERWKAQYKKNLFRYLFSVLDGPSRLGKTQFALSLVRDTSAMHVVNCAAAQEPDLRQFKYGTHEGVLFDEIEPAAVARQRLLF